MKAVLAVIVSLCLGLLLCEASLRLFTHYGPGAPEPSSAKAITPDQPLDLEGALPYVQKLPAAPDTDRRWFTENPPDLPNRSAIDPRRVALYAEYERRGIFAPQADYIWNRRFVEGTSCAPSSVFANYPDKVLAFDPPSGDAHPHYRFPPNTTTASGLVTNQFGLRGPPIELIKPPKTVRIAFVGASTTINNHNFPFSFPERVVYWFNRYAAANHFDVHFEVLNAGREGLNSEDMPPIVRYELLPLNPDLAVYYEGANQFPTANRLVWPPVVPRKNIDPHDPVVAHKIPEWIRTRFATGNLLDLAANRFSSIGEPVKPRYKLRWPEGVDEQHPQIDKGNLPLQLPVIMKDLDSIRTSMRSLGGELAVCSFVWLARDGLPLSPTRHEFIYKQLNTVLWPLRYADIRRLADFQNRVFKNYAAARKIPFVDIASEMPQDPNLFIDGIHMTDTGERMKAWIVFQQLAPLIRREIESGQLPRPRPSNVPPMPSLAFSEMSAHCGEGPTGKITRLEDAVSIYRRQAATRDATIDNGRPLHIVTNDRQWAYAATFPINMPASVTGRVFAFVRARVIKGQIGIGVLDRRENAFLIERGISASGAMADFYLPVSDPNRADQLIIRNTAPDGTRSEILVEDMALVMSPR